MPWSAVGPGWVLAQWRAAGGRVDPGKAPGGASPAATIPTHLELVSPSGSRYGVGELPADAGLVEWSGDGRRALALLPSSGYQLVDLTTGATTPLHLPAGDDVSFTRPHGTALLTWNPAQRTLVRSTLTGAPESTYPTTVPGGGMIVGGIAYRPDGLQFAVGTSGGLAVFDNGGGAGRALSTGGGACTPERWLDTSTILAACQAPGRGTARLWDVPASGAAATPVTAVPSGQDFGDLDAWTLPSGTYSETAGACGYEYAAKVGPGGVTTPLQIPHLPAGDSSLILGTAGDRLVVQAWSSCHGGGTGGSVFTYDPVTGAESALLGPSAGGADVVAAKLLGP